MAAGFDFVSLIYYLFITSPFAHFKTQFGEFHQIWLKNPNFDVGDGEIRLCGNKFFARQHVEQKNYLELILRKKINHASTES